ncbi:MAG: hypothetical protein HY057_09575 [Rhodospirillales bacterium]|nr:hypothetical protein [Rhodospirillales bacterium]
MGNSQIGDRLIALFLLGVFAFSPPLLAIFSVEARVFGIPLLFVYLFAAWGGLIGLLALAMGRRGRDDGDAEPPAADG